MINEKDFYFGVPFSGCEKHIKNPIITAREDEAVSMAVGAMLAGKKPLVFLQNSGLGNCFDVLTSLCIPYGIEPDILVDNRIEPEHHRVMGERCAELMKVIGYENVSYLEEVG